MIVFQTTQCAVTTALDSVARVVERRHTLPILKKTTAISNGMLAGTVCEANTDLDSTGADGPPPVAASDDDDGGESDGEPARRRSRNNARRAAAPLPPFRPTLLGFAPLAHDTGMCRSRIYQLIRESGFPPPIKVGKSSRWLTAEVDQWIAAQAAARQTQQSAG